jgi:N-acetylglucosaminyldiphosphoundecaprenol N-acetyl-beta-D-mannosaminyltransferase
VDAVPSTLASHEILGFKITPITSAQILDLICQNVQGGTTCVIASQNIHGIYKYFTDESFRELHGQACVHIDGMPLVWLARLRGLPVSRQHRTALIDCVPPLLGRAVKEGWRVFYLGGSPNVVQRGLQILRDGNPGLQIDGHHGFFAAAADSDENRSVIDRIHAFRPHVLMVGMGMGRQERWILDNQDRLPVNCIWTCGAMLEYFAGAAPIAPRWLGQIGLEWAYRLCSNPRRFAWRYLIEPWVVVGLIVADRVRAAMRMQ